MAKFQVFQVGDSLSAPLIIEADEMLTEDGRTRFRKKDGISAWTVAVLVHAPGMLIREVVA
jgi:hypothetical protein